MKKSNFSEAWVDQGIKENEGGGKAEDIFTEPEGHESQSCCGKNTVF